MKKSARTIGIIGAVIMLLAGYFRMMHFPGGILFQLISTLLILYFLVVWFDFIEKNVSGSKEKYAFIALFVILIFTFISNLFKNLHYPGANILIYIHLILLVAAFIPLFIIYNKSLKDEYSKTQNFAFMIFYIAVSGLLLIKGTSSVGVLNSVAVIDEHINQSIKNIEAGNKNIIASLINTPNAQKAERIRASSDSLYNYIADLKSELIYRTEGIDKKIADTINPIHIKSKDNYDMPTNYLIGNSQDGSKGAARVLKNKIENYKKNLLEIVNPEIKDSLLNIIGLSTKIKLANKNGVKITWEMENFYHMILISDIAILSHLQSDVRYAESKAISALYYGKIN